MSWQRCGPAPTPRADAQEDLSLYALHLFVCLSICVCGIACSLTFLCIPGTRAIAFPQKGSGFLLANFLKPLP